MRLSISRVKLFKSCRRAFWFRYVEDLEPVQKADALTLGSNYHKMIESLCHNEPLDLDNDYSVEHAMFSAYKKYVYPSLKIRACEEWFEKDLNGFTFIGRVDGIAEDGSLVEHKTTSASDLEEYEYGLQWDEQILAYMFLTGKRKMQYSVCRKPTIRRKKSETEEEFFQRMVEWYDEDPDKKIRVIRITRTDDEVNEFVQELQDVSEEIERGVIYRNTNYCNCWGRRCEYSSICLSYDPNQEYVEFIKGGRR